MHAHMDTYRSTMARGRYMAMQSVWDGALMTQYIYYHDPCYDGWAAAWIAKRHVMPQATLVPCAYGAAVDPPPPGSEVLMLDFSLPRAEMLTFGRACASLTVLDHHATAAAHLAGFDWAIFDQEESGASLTWKTLVSQRVPDLIQYVRDRDLWRWALPGSREVSAWYMSYPRDLETWDHLATVPIDDAISAGADILRVTQQRVEELVGAAQWLEVGGYRVPVVNTPVHMSEVCHRLLELHPTAAFAGYYFDRADSQRQWGLRSAGDMDVSKVAEGFGGGGHTHAAGFETSKGGVV